MTDITDDDAKLRSAWHRTPRWAVSVIMPVARVDRFLDATLESIDAQSWRDFELLVICDDRQYEALQTHLMSKSLHCYWRIVSTPMHGFAFALNLGIAMADAEFIARWDADDLCDPSRLARQVETFRANPRLALLGTRAVLIDGDGKPLSFHHVKFYATNEAIRRALRYRQAIVHSALMMRRTQALAWGGYCYGYASEDHAMYLRVARDPALEFGNLGDVCCYYRRHEAQLSGRSRQFNQFCEIAGFMVAEFLHTGHPMYLVGALANLPLARDMRRVVRTVQRAVAGALCRFGKTS